MVKRGITVLLLFFMSSLLISTPFTLAVELELIYDGNGNLITGDGKYREYNEFNQLIRVKEGNSDSGEILEEYVHHPTEDRVLIKRINTNKAAIGFEETTVYASDNFVRKYTIAGTTYVNDTYYAKDENGIVAEVTFNGTVNTPTFTQRKKLFYHNDHLGSTSVITNESGSLVEETFYTPYGKILSGGEVSRYDYEGKEFSETTDDYDFDFRKYNPEIGVFNQPEQIFPNLYDPQQLNRYRFERNNPYRYVDEDGKEPVSVIAGAIVGVAIGGIN